MSNSRPVVHKGNGAPSHCWTCNKQLMRVHGYKGLFHFVRVIDRGGQHHRIHLQCVPAALEDGEAKLV